MSTTAKMDMPIRTALAGFGLSGSVFHAPLLGADPEFSLEMISTSDRERIGNAEQRYPGAVVVPSPSELLDSAEQLDLLVIATPPATHFGLALAALKAGLDVVVDKPFAVSSAQGREVAELAGQLGRTLTVFHNRRWDGDFITAKSLVTGGLLGDVSRFESRFERWQPTVTKPWKAVATAADGGGALFDLGTHLVDQALELFGPAVVTHAELSAHRPGGSADDDAFVVLQHHSGVISHLSMNLLCAQVSARMRVLGSAAAYTKQGLDPQEPFLAAGGSPRDPDYGVEDKEWAGLLGRDGHLDAVTTERGQYPVFYRMLAEVLRSGGARSGKPLPVEPGHAIRVLEIIEQARDIALGERPTDRG